MKFLDCMHYEQNDATSFILKNQLFRAPSDIDKASQINIINVRATIYGHRRSFGTETSENGKAEHFTKT